MLAAQLGGGMLVVLIREGGKEVREMDRIIYVFFSFIFYKSIIE